MARKWVSVAIQLAEVLIFKLYITKEIALKINPLLNNGIAQMVSVAMVTKFSHEY